jgi:plasmid stability protein
LCYRQVAEQLDQGSVASLIVRRLDEDLVRRLKARALAHGRSAEAEHRAILEAALRPELSGRELWRKLSRGGPAEIDFENGADQRPDIVDFG